MQYSTTPFKACERTLLCVCVSVRLCVRGVCVRMVYVCVCVCECVCVCDLRKTVKVG